MSLFKKIIITAILIFLSYMIIKPLFSPGFFPIHDDTQVARIFEMAKALSDGMFPVRWVPDLGYGYGYPIFNFYAPLPYYFGGLLVLIGFDPLVATKIIMGVGAVVSGIFMYLLSREFWGQRAAIIASAFYLYAPYHALNIYVRGDVSESWAYAFIPLVFFGMWKASKTRKWKYVIIGAFGYSAVILSHNLTALMVTPFLFGLPLFIYLVTKEKRELIFLSIPLALGIAVSCFYWLPALLEMKYTNVMSQIGGGANFRDHFVCIYQLWDSAWGFGGSAPGCIDGLSFKIGKLHILATVLAMLFVVLRNHIVSPFSKISNKKYTFVLYALIISIVSVFLTLDASKLIWETIPVMAFFQYPWRLLSLIAFGSSFLAGFLFWIFEHYQRINFSVLTIAFILVLVSTLLLYSKLFRPQTTFQAVSSDYIKPEVLRWKTSKISDEYMPVGFERPLSEEDVPQRKIISLDEASVKILEEKTQFVSAQVESQFSSSVIVHTAYFPSWRAYIDGKETAYFVDKRGLVIDVAAGRHFVSTIFTQTFIQKTGNVISVAGVFVLFLGIIYTRWGRIKGKLV